jgi:heat shock protein 5
MIKSSIALAVLSALSATAQLTNVIGIDLGTTYSCAAVMRKSHVEVIANDQGSRTTPSYFALDEKGQELVGQAAKNMMGQCWDPRDPSTPNGSCVVFDSKRLIGKTFSISSDASLIKSDQKHWPFEVENDNGRPTVIVRYGAKGEHMRKYVAEQLSAKTLGYMKKIAEDYTGKEVTKAVVTVPAYFTDAQRQATKDAGVLAGLEILRLINEPTAAAMAYGFDQTKAEKKLLVFDLGGGTFDVSVLTLDGGVFEVVATNGDGHLGGQDFDNRIISWIYDEVNNKHPDVKLKTDSYLARERSKIRGLAENAKRSLSSQTSVKIDVPIGAGKPEVILELTRARFEDMCMDLFKKTIEKVDEALRDAKWKKSEVDEIVLVGGSTRIPKVQEMLSKYFNNKELNKSVNPDEAVAYGAALQAGILMGNKATDDLLLIDVTPLSLGIETMGGAFTKLIEKNTAIPTKKTQTFSTAADNQRAVNIRILEGERALAKDNHLLGSFELTGIPPAPRGVPQIEVSFEVDVSGILKVDAHDKGTGSRQSITIKNDKSRLTPEQIEKMIKEAELHKEEDQRIKENMEAKTALDSYLYSVKDLVSDTEKGVAGKISDEDKKRIQDTLKEAREWIDKNGETAVKEDFEEQREKVQKVIDPITRKIYEGASSGSQQQSSEESERDEL